MINDRGRCSQGLCHRPACVAPLSLRRGLGWCQGELSPARTLHWAEAMSDFTLSLADELPDLVLPVPAGSAGVFSLPSAA